MADWPGRAVARHLVHLPPNPPLAPGLVVRELVALGRFPWMGMATALWFGTDGADARLLAGAAGASGVLAVLLAYARGG